MLASNTLYPRQPLLAPAFHGTKATQAHKALLRMLGTKTSLSVTHGDQGVQQLLAY